MAYPIVSIETIIIASHRRRHRHGRCARADGFDVPMEPHYPEARIFGILEQVAPRVVLTTSSLGSRVDPVGLGAEAGAWATLGIGGVLHGRLELTLLHSASGRRSTASPEVDDRCF